MTSGTCSIDDYDLCDKWSSLLAASTCSKSEKFATPANQTILSTPFTSSIRLQSSNIFSCPCVSTPGRQFDEVPTPAFLFFTSPKLLPSKEKPSQPQPVPQLLSHLQAVLFSLLFIVNRTDNCLSLKLMAPANNFFQFPDTTWSTKPTQYSMLHHTSISTSIHESLVLLKTKVCNFVNGFHAIHFNYPFTFWNISDKTSIWVGPRRKKLIRKIGTGQPSYNTTVQFGC